MNKAEWDAMCQEDRDGMTAEAVMNWRLCEVEEITGRWQWRDSEDQLQGHRKSFQPTTDRNACALVLDEVDLPILLTHLLAVTGETDIDISGRAGTKAMCNLLRADTDTICYCAIKAASDVPEV